MNVNLMPPEKQNFFCEHWETAKAILEDVRTFSPGWIAKLAASLLIKIGDKAHSKICATHES